ncbi:MAG: hypothetical protein H0T65_20335 [Deltaproteobacteria bacterium]|nr:hypothetical protein [Deltaproteobacteria bacterium]
MLTLFVAHAHAEVDIKEADRLFAVGLSLRDTNREQSCKYFHQSLEKNPNAIGTLMNVALCDELLGKIASAYARFSEARDRAKEGNLPDYIEEAEAHISTLKVDLPHVTITFLGERPKGTRVLIGDIIVSSTQLDEKSLVAVDPGELVIVVSAPGRLAYETRMMIGKKETKPIEVPELKKGVTVKGSSRKSIGIITTAAGGGLLITGQVLALVARSKYREFKKAPFCDAMDICEAEAQAEIEKAITLGNVGTVVSVVGLAAAGIGVYLWLSAPSEPTEKRLTFVPNVTPESAGITAIGRF